MQLICRFFGFKVLFSTPSYSTHVHWVISSTSWLNYHQYLEPQIYRSGSFLPSHCVPNCLLGISTWRELIHLRLPLSKTNLAFPPDSLFCQRYPHPPGCHSLFLRHLLCSVNKCVAFSLLSMFPATSQASSPLSFTWVTSTAFSIGFLSPVLFGTLPFPSFFPLIT